MFEHLRVMFPANEYALMPQVRNGTGFNKVTRTADAVAISLWPSRGINLFGFEFKDSRADVLKELASPEKSDEIGKHCAFWYLVVSDPKFITKDELPTAWGLIAVKDGGIKKIVQAPKREAVPPDLSLMASILKSAQGSVTGEDDVQRRIKAAVEKAERASREYHEKDIENKRLLAAGRINDLDVAYRKYKDETGIDILHQGWGSRTLGKAVKFVMDGGLDDLSLVVGWCERVSREAKQLLGEPECHS